MVAGPAPTRVRLDDSVTRQRVKPGTIRRILPYARRYRWSLAFLVFFTVLDAVITAANPLILRVIVNDGILRHRAIVVVSLSLIIVGLALMDALLVYVQARLSARIGQGVVYELRGSVFAHVQQQPLAFFARAQTGALVSRLNTDVIGAQQAVTSLLSQAVSTVLTLIFLLSAMFYLSWQISIAALALIPVVLLPARLIGGRVERVTRE